MTATSVQPTGLHHVTAIASDPQRNLDFWFHVLGQRLIKQTVNFDAPDVYHLYYGNEAGDPGTVMTFFPWPGAAAGRHGAGQATVTSYSVPEASIGWWATHLRGLGVEVEELTTRFDEDALRLRDPDGLIVELIAHEGGVGAPWDGGPIPVEHAIRGFHSVTLTESSLDGTSGLFLDTLNFSATDESPDRVRFETGDGGLGRSVDIVVDPSAPRGLVASGTVHHIAWRAPDDTTQLDWRSQIVESGTQVTDVLDRQYFRSIYFREPGGVLLEVGDRPARLHGRRTAARARPPPQAAALAGAEPRGDRGQPPDPAPAGRAHARRPRRDHRARGPPVTVGLDAHTYLFEPPPAGTVPSERTLVLLHGTGADERDLLPLGRFLDPAATALSPRGNVLEHGMPRWFARLGEGVLDTADVARRADDLADVAGGRRRAPRPRPVPARRGGVQQRRERRRGGAPAPAGRVVRGAALFAPMVPLEPDTTVDLTGTDVFVSAGRRDVAYPVSRPTSSPGRSSDRGAAVVRSWHDGGHELPRSEAEAAREWLAASGQDTSR